MMSGHASFFQANRHETVEVLLHGDARDGLVQRLRRITRQGKCLVQRRTSIEIQVLRARRAKIPIHLCQRQRQCAVEVPSKSYAVFHGKNRTDEVACNDARPSGGEQTSEICALTLTRKRVRIDDRGQTVLRHTRVKAESQIVGFTGQSELTALRSTRTRWTRGRAWRQRAHVVFATEAKRIQIRVRVDVIEEIVRFITCAR